MNADRQRDELSVLILAPAPRDRQMGIRVLEDAGFEGRGFVDAGELVESAREHGAGMFLVASEALLAEGAMDQLSALLRKQEPWSDLPVCILMHRRLYHMREFRAVRELENLHSITFLERPLKIATMISMTRSALQARRRQYQIRQLLKEAEDAVRQRDEFLAMLSHELRNPLSAITNALYVIKKAPERAEKAMHILGNQVGQVNRMVDDLLDVARITRDKVELRRENVDLVAVVKEALDSQEDFIQSQRHELAVKVPEAALGVEGDRVRLMQIVTNLLQNAGKYTDPGGHVGVSLYRDGDAAVLEVSDDGIGLDEDSQARIFELFAQGKRKLDRGQGGLGIGLTIVQRLVRMHEGQIAVHSEGLGKGCRFVLTLPLAKGKAEAPAGSEGGEADAQGCRVMVVDDNREVADGLAMLVDVMGHEVRTVYSGEDALDAARSYRPEVIFLDLGMPDMDGYEVASRLRMLEGGERMTLVAVSGYGDRESRAKARRCGFDLHLLKPPSLNMVEGVMSRAVCDRDQKSGVEVGR